jgi:hypothetical protein
MSATGRRKSGCHRRSLPGPALHSAEPHGRSRRSFRDCPRICHDVFLASRQAWHGCAVSAAAPPIARPVDANWHRRPSPPYNPAGPPRTSAVACATACSERRQVHPPKRICLKHIPDHIQADDANLAHRRSLSQRCFDTRHRATAVLAGCFHPIARVLPPCRSG